MYCVECNKETKNAKFCSRSCSTTSNNKKNPRRVKTKTCKSCDTLIFKSRLYCKSCWDITKKAKDITLGEARYTHLHVSSAYSLVRSRARAVAKEQGWNSCGNCNYDLHIEIAHIKAIGDFSEDTRLSVINAISNLLPLCPNCHWEFDHGLLAL